MSEIWTVSEESNDLLGLIAHAKGLCRSDDKVVSWACSPEAAEAARTHGADSVYRLTGLARPEDWVDTIVHHAESAGPVAILFGASKRCKELAGRVAAALDTGLSTECDNVGREESFSAHRYVYGGLCVATEVAIAAPFMATMAKGSVSPLAESSPVAVEEVAVVGDSPQRVVDFHKREGKTNLGDAKIIVCVGRGVARQEDVALAEKLASVLHAEVGCSRPVAEELHWMPEDQYIGISGQKVKPELYFGLGVSGQVQHMSGLRDAKLVVGIDRNESAPIVAAADYALVGDLYEIVPLLIEALGSGSATQAKG
jgi:electron transfer flavoprotein alpha subunit